MLSKTKITLALALSSLSFAPAASAADLYAGFFRPSGGVAQKIYIGQSASEFIATDNIEFPAGMRIVDFEGYRDSSGARRYNTQWEKGTGTQIGYLNQTASGLDAKIASNLTSGRHPTSVTSWAAVDGSRRYAVVFKPKTGGFDYKLGETTAEFTATFNANAALGLWPTLLETYLSADGSRRWDTVYGDTSGGGWQVSISMNENTFANKVASEALAGRNVAWVETYRTKNHTVLYTAMFNTVAPVSNFYLSQDLATFTATYQAEELAGNNLMDMSIYVDVTDASWENYGNGLAGTNGVPELTLSGDPNIGMDVAVNIGNSRGVPTLCVFFVGLSETSIPLLGGQFLVNPLTQFSFVVPPSGVALPVTMPTDYNLDGVELYNQIVEEDPGGVFGVSISRGLKMTFGRLE